MLYLAALLSKSSSYPPPIPIDPVLSFDDYVRALDFLSSH